MSGITGVNDVYYSVEDMKRAVAFYRDVLGLRVIDENPYWTSLDLGGVRVGLHWTEGKKLPYIARDDHGPHAGACLTLRVEDIHSTVEQLRRRGVRFLGDVTDAPWGSLATFEDSEGNVLKMMEPPRGGRRGSAAAAAASSAVASLSAAVEAASVESIPTAAGPALQPCVKCGGGGRAHDSSMPHRENGCIFCTECSGCEGAGVIPATAIQCPKCQGKGKSHDSSMPHKPGCIFCKTCKTCHGKGHVG